jgi:8-oxo-dGTP pyrophosphatase MutT (NUDIX family)
MPRAQGFLPRTSGPFIFCADARFPDKVNQPVPLDLSESEIAARLRAAYHPAEQEHDPHYRCAAVLVPLTRHEDDWHLLFTERTHRVQTHKSQVSFPGGTCDPQDGTPEATALREAEEEVGIQPRDVRVLGRLNVMLTVTGFRIVPVIGVVPWPYTFKISTIEVARVFSMPLRWLAEPGNRRAFSLAGRPVRQLTAFIPYDGELLWGATAQMTVDFLRVLGLE